MVGGDRGGAAPVPRPMGTGFPRHDEVFVGLTGPIFFLPTRFFVTPGTPGIHGGVTPPSSYRGNPVSTVG